jgi:hypothetical protein
MFRKWHANRLLFNLLRLLALVGDDLCRCPLCCLFFFGQSIKALKIEFSLGWILGDKLLAGRLP